MGLDNFKFLKLRMKKTAIIIKLNKMKIFFKIKEFSLMILHRLIHLLNKFKIQHKVQEKIFMNQIIFLNRKQLKFRINAKTK